MTALNRVIYSDVHHRSGVRLMMLIIMMMMMMKKCSRVEMRNTDVFAPGSESVSTTPLFTKQTFS